MYTADLLTKNIIQKEMNDKTLNNLIHIVKLAEIRYSVDKLD